MSDFGLNSALLNMKRSRFRLRSGRGKIGPWDLSSLATTFLHLVGLGGRWWGWVVPGVPAAVPAPGLSRGGW